MFSTALDDGEIVTEISFQIPESAGYAKFRNPASRYAMAGVFVAKSKSGVRVAVTGAAPCVFRVPEMEAALAAEFLPDAVAIHRRSARRPQLRHSRFGGISRPSRYRDGQARGASGDRMSMMCSIPPRNGWPAVAKLRLAPSSRPGAPHRGRPAARSRFVMTARSSGSVSGGCVEGAVIESAQSAMIDGKIRKLEFGVSDEQAWSVGLACGGQIEVFVEPLG